MSEPTCRELLVDLVEAASQYQGAGTSAMVGDITQSDLGKRAFAVFHATERAKAFLEKP